MKFVRHIALIVISLLVSIAVYSQSNALRYQEILDHAVAKGLPAITVLVKTPNGVEWRGKSGVKRVEDSIAIEVNQSFRIASITKIFTSIIILQMLDEGKLKLSDTISKYLSPAVNGIIPNVNRITIYQLLSHSSGIYSFTENNRFCRIFEII